MIRRFFTRLLVVALVAFCGYNWLEIRALRAEVSDLKTRQTITESAHDRPYRSSADWRNSAQELERGLEGLKEAAQSPETRRRFEALQRQTRQIGAQADALWRHAQ